MAHELETQNGVASFASFREPAWHNLGTVFDTEKNTNEMLVAANLNNWNVRLEDLEIPSSLVSDKQYQYVVRTNPTDKSQTDVLGIVGERYVPLQNEDLFSFGDNILDGGGRWETAGSIRGGRVVFGSLAGVAGHTQVVVFEMLGSCSIDMVAVTLGAEILVGYMQFFDIGHNYPLGFTISLTSPFSTRMSILASATLGAVGLVSNVMICCRRCSFVSGFCFTMILLGLDNLT
jgi:hypothetical protein